MNFKEFYEDLTPYEQQLYFQNYILRKQLRKTIDEQTIMFWNLQLQFLSMSIHELNEYCPSKIANVVIRTYKYGEDFEGNLATELALHLSGLK